MTALIGLFIVGAAIGLAIGIIKIVGYLAIAIFYWLKALFYSGNLVYHKHQVQKLSEKMSQGLQEIFDNSAAQYIAAQEDPHFYEDGRACFRVWIYPDRENQIVPGITVTMTREDLEELRSVTFDSNGDPIAVSAIGPEINIRTIVNHS
jgi:hypothetical protein